MIFANPTVKLSTQQHLSLYIYKKYNSQFTNDEEKSVSHHRERKTLAYSYR